MGFQIMKVKCSNKKCKYNDEELFCTKKSLFLSKSPANYNHLEEYMLACISFEEREE